jgi:hypothetical protein
VNDKESHCHGEHKGDYCDPDEKTAQKEKRTTEFSKHSYHQRRIAAKSHDVWKGLGELIKVGKFINDNHESIGTILSGVGSIIGGLPNSDIKVKLSSYADGAGRANNFIYGGYGGLRRPSNTPRTQFSNNLTNKNEEGSPALTKQSAPPMNYNPEVRQNKVRHLI